jgi:hypothetical protein
LRTASHCPPSCLKTWTPSRLFKPCTQTTLPKSPYPSYVCIRYLVYQSRKKQVNLVATRARYIHSKLCHSRRIVHRAPREHHSHQAGPHTHIHSCVRLNTRNVGAGSYSPASSPRTPVQLDLRVASHSSHATTATITFPPFHPINKYSETSKVNEINCVFPTKQKGHRISILSRHSYRNLIFFP